jgi:hypothetical protein
MPKTVIGNLKFILGNHCISQNYCYICTTILTSIMPLETKLPVTTKAEDELIMLRKRKAMGVLTLKELQRLNKLESKLQQP